MTPIILRTVPAVAPEFPTHPRPGPALRVTEAPGGFEVGMGVPGHADLRVGFVTAEQLFAFARRVLDAASERMAAEWHRVPALNGKAGAT